MPSQLGTGSRLPEEVLPEEPLSLEAYLPTRQQLQVEGQVAQVSAGGPEPAHEIGYAQPYLVEGVG